MQFVDLITQQRVNFSRFWRYVPIVCVSLAMLAALLLPLNILSLHPFHHDEALYATWALQISSGKDFWLVDTPIDKPPLLLYTLAATMHLLDATETTARIPSLVATALIVLFTFVLGQKLYTKTVGILAAWLVALSPFTLLFAPTAFTDPLLVALVLAGCLAAVHNRAGWAGFFMALAIATKQQGVFFVPLVVMLVWVGCVKKLSPACYPFGYAQDRSERAQRVKNPQRLDGDSSASPQNDIRWYSKLTIQWVWFAVAMFVTLVPALVWDFTRNQPSSFFQQSARNYGGLYLDFAGFGERWQGFVDLLYYATASPTLNIIFVVGCPLLLAFGLWQKTSEVYSINFFAGCGRLKTNVEAQTMFKPRRSENLVPTAKHIGVDWTLALFSIAFLLIHAMLSFQVWDRYLLGLIPLLALLMARVLTLPWRLFKHFWRGKNSIKVHSPIHLIYSLVLIWLLATTMLAPVKNAVQAHYPLGSNSHALQGIEQITAYLQGNAGANTTLYHRWLGTHWRFYLWNYPYDLQFWDSPQMLVDKAKPGHLIAFPTWHSDSEVRLALFEAGLRLTELTRAYAANGAPSIILYRIEPLSP